MRPSGRAFDDLRSVSLETDFSKYAEGSCLIKFGDTHVLCTASIDDSVPPFLRKTGKGWVTAEYGMLPRSTESRIDRRRAAGSGRTQEIQRLIGRSLRARSQSWTVSASDKFGWIATSFRLTAAPAPRRLRADTSRYISPSGTCKLWARFRKFR